MSELVSAISTSMDVSDYKALTNVKVSRVSIQPENKSDITMTAGNTSDLFVSYPSRPNSFLDGNNSYLTFTYTMEGTAHGTGRSVAFSNGTPSSLIRTLETIAGSTSIELINSYNVISAVVDDFQHKDRAKTLGTILEDKHASDHKAGFSRDVATATSAGFTQKRRICIPLMSLAVGSLADKYFPMGSDIGLRLRLTMEDPNIAFRTEHDSDADFAVGYKLEDITYEATYLETDAKTYNQIVKESGGVMKVSGTGIGNFSHTVPQGGTTNTVLIPARYSSVRSYMTTMRDGDSATKNAYNSPGGRTRANLTSYVYRIHGKNYPNLPVVCDEYTSSESFCEFLKTLHSLHNTSQSCVFPASAYVHSGDNHQGSFVFGLDLEEQGFSSSSMSGLDTNSGNTFLELIHSSAVPSTGLVVDTFCFYDAIVEINTTTGEVMVSK